MSDLQDVPALVAPQYIVNYALGPAQIGYTVQVFLLGVFTSMFVRYAGNGELRRHGTLGQLALWTSLTLNWLYTGMCVYELYTAAVSQRRDLYIFFHGTPVKISLAVVGGIIGLVTQFFLSAHAGVLIPHATLRTTFYLWIAVLMATEALGFLSQFIGAHLMGVPDDPFISQIGTTFSIWLWANATADLSISLVCAFSLRTRLHGYTRETDSILHKLVVISFRTAAHTSFVAIVSAILSTIYHSGFNLHLYVTFAFWLGLPGLYGIALFTFSTSSRHVIRHRGDAQATDHSVPLAGPNPPKAGVIQSIRSAHSRMVMTQSRSTNAVPIEVRVTQEQFVTVEEPEDDALRDAGPVMQSRRERMYSC